MSFLMRRSRIPPSSPRCSLSSLKQSRHIHQSPAYRSSTVADPQRIADAFLSKFSNGQTFVRKQFLDANQLRLFSLTLDRPQIWSGPSSRGQTLESNEPVDGTPIPAGYHQAYFTPGQLPGILGFDGTDASFNPEAPFTRRMWAGGSLHWPNSSPTDAHFLRVGDTATEITKVLSCEPKIIKKTGEHMLVVGVEKEFRDSKDELCVVDRRSWVFRKALDLSNPTSPPVKPALRSESELAEMGQGKVTRQFNRDVVQLFRISALTFNGHRIHYDLPWATQVEGHRGLVVHGPLNLLSMLDMWRDEAVRRGEGANTEGVVFPKQIEYRATSPVYAGEAYRIHMGYAEKGTSELKVVSDDGTTCMKGTIEDWP